MKTHLLSCIVLMMVFGSTALAQPAGVRLAHVFQDGMVLQRQMEVPIWGWAPAGAEVTVTFADQRATATADANGRWRVVLQPMEANATGQSLKLTVGDQSVERRDILVGEVWIAAGQSNMVHAGPNRDTGVYPHHQSTGMADGKPPIRIARFGWGASLEPLADIDVSQHSKNPWQTLAETPTLRSGGIPQYFAQVLRDKLNVPVGIVHVAVSGTNQAAWMAKPTLEAFLGAGEHANFYQQFYASMAANLARGAGPIRTWEQFAEAESQWRATGEGGWPGAGMGTRLLNFPTALYNTRIAPLGTLAFRGVIWHQGEGGPGGPYGKRLVAMARQWREQFGHDFHFIWGTLSRSTTASPPLDPVMSWFYRSGTNDSIREALLHFGDDKKVAMVELFDVGNHDTHFDQKAEAGRRMALAALTNAYGQDHLYTGPLVTELNIEGEKATAVFTHVGEGLRYQPSIEGISGVIVRAADDSLAWAAVEVKDKDTIEIRHPQGQPIVGVGYAVTSNPHETVFNSAGLPASPFGHNVGQIPWAGHGGGTAMVTQTGERDAQNRLNLAHVRRDGYVFQITRRNPPAGATVPVRAYVSSEWPGVRIKVGDRIVTGERETEDGRTFVKFNAPIDGTWVIVATPDKVGDFEKVNRY